MRAGMEASRLTCFAGPEDDPILSFGLPFEPEDSQYGESRFTYYCLWALQPTLVEYEHSGTVFGAINKRQFEALLVIDPPKALVDFFAIHSREWEDRIRSNTFEGRALAEQRDVLLPKLVSGEVGVGELMLCH